MDRLVKVEEAKVELHFRPKKRCVATFRLTSLIHTMPVAVKLSTTRQHSYSFFPDEVALLPPLSSAVFKLVLRPTASPPFSFPPDFIIVGTLLAPAIRRARYSSLRSFFSRPALPIFHDASIPIHLVGPQALRSLLLPGVSSGSARIMPSSPPVNLSATLLAGNGQMALEKRDIVGGGRCCRICRWLICLRFFFREKR